MKKTIISFMGVCLALSVQGMTFDEILQNVASNNPSLAVSSAKINAEKSAMKSENNLPDPEIGFEHKWGNEGTKWGVDISQSFEWPGVYSSRKKAINKATQALDYLNQANRLDKLIEIKLLLIDIVNTHKQLALMNKIDSQINSLIIKYQQGFNNGEVSRLDINKLNIEKINISREINQLNNQKNELEAILLQENGGNDISVIISSLNEYSNEVILPKEKYEELLRENDPEMAQFSLMAQSNELNAKVVKMSKFPGFSVGYKLENELGTYFNGFSIGITLPTFSQRHKSATIKATQELISLQNKEFEIGKLAQLNVQRENAIRLFQEMENYRPTLENQDNITLLKKALDGGQINLITYIQEVNFFLEAQQNYLDVEYRYYQTLASLNRYSLLNK